MNVTTVVKQIQAKRSALIKEAGQLQHAIQVLESIGSSKKASPRKKRKARTSKQANGYGAIVAALQAGGPMRTNELHAKLGKGAKMKASSLSVKLPAMAKAGVIKRVSPGLYAAPKA